MTLGDVNGDGTVDIIAGAGPGGGPHVRVFSGADLTRAGELLRLRPGVHRRRAAWPRATSTATAAPTSSPARAPAAGRTCASSAALDLSELASFFAYDPAFTGRRDRGRRRRRRRRPAPTSSPARAPAAARTCACSAAPTLQRAGELLRLRPAFAGGVSVAAGDVNGDGLADIITGAGPAAARTCACSAALDLGELASFYGLDPAFGGGVNVAAGDIDGDGRVDLILGRRAPGGGPSRPHLSAASTSASSTASSPARHGERHFRRLGR